MPNIVVVAEAAAQDPSFRELLRGPLRRYYSVTLIVSLAYGLIFVFNVVYIHNIRHHTVLFATS